MRIRVVLISSLLAMVSGVSYGDECTELGIAVGQEIVRSSVALDKESLDKYDFCRYDYSKASNEEKASIEASYTKVASVDARKETKNIQEAQSQVCEGRYGFAKSAALNTRESRTWSPMGKEVLDACFQQEAVRITAATYSAKQVRFTVRNGTLDKVAIRDYQVSPREMVDQCSIVNYETGLFGGGKYIAPHKSVEVICGLKTRTKAGTDATQLTYGGGFIALDAPATTLKSLPVPEVTDPSTGEVERMLRGKLAEAERVSGALRGELKVANDKVTVAEALTVKVRGAANEAQSSAIQRLHVVTHGIPKAVPNTPRFHALEDNGVPCDGVEDGGVRVTAFAAKVCGGAGNYAFDSVVSVQGGACGRSVAAIMCKAPIP